MREHGFIVGQKIKVKSVAELKSIIDGYSDLHEVAREYIEQVAGGTFYIERIVGNWIYLNADKNNFMMAHKQNIYLHPSEIKPAGIDIEIDESLFEL